MRITYIHQYFNTRQMTGGTRSFEMAKRLVAAGHRVEMVTSWRFEGSPPGIRSRGWHVSQEDGIHVHWVPIRYGNEMSYPRRVGAFLLFALRAAHRVARLPSDVVFATSTPLTVAIPAIWGSRRLAVPMVFEVRDLWPEVPIQLGVLRNPLLKWLALALERAAYLRASNVVVVAPGMSEHVIGKGVKPDRVSVIPNGSDVDLFEEVLAEVPDLRSRYDWLGDRPLIVHVGALGLINDVEYLVRAAAAAASIDEEVMFATVGSGRDEQRVRGLASELGVLDRTFHMLGQVGKREAATWTAAADVATVLCGSRVPAIQRRDLVPNKFFDALAAGRPVAYNYEGYSAQVAEEAGAGVAMPPDDPEAAGRLLVERVRDADWLEKAGAAAKRLARERFDRDLLAAALLDVLECAAEEDARA